VRLAKWDECEAARKLLHFIDVEKWRVKPVTRGNHVNSVLSFCAYEGVEMPTKRIMA
jgi:hypothetical protein